MEKLEAEYKKLAGDEPYGPLSEMLSKTLNQDVSRIRCTPDRDL